MMIAPKMAPVMLSRPPMMTIGNTLNPTNARPRPPPETKVHKTPAATEITPAMPQTIRKWWSPNRHRRLPVIGNSLQCETRTTAAVKGADEGNAKSRDNRRDQLIGRDRHSADHYGLCRDRQRDRARHPGKGHRADAAHDRPQAERDHDQGDRRRRRHSAQHQPAKGDGQGNHTRAAEDNGADEPQPEGVHPNRDKERAPHDPLADREIDHA